VTLVIALADVVATLVALVKNEEVPVVTAVTTGVVVGVPFRKGTVSMGRPRLLPKSWRLLGGLPAVVELLAPKWALGAAKGLVLSNAMVRRLGLPVPGTMPVIVVVGAVTLVTAVPVTGVSVALVKNGTGPGLAVTFVKAAAIVGVTAVTTVSPGLPLTPLTTSAKVGLTPVTHVAAEAEDNSTA
jgi:hypothetical protein